MIFIAVSHDNREREIEGGRQFLGTPLFHVMETPFLSRQGTTKGYFHSFDEKGQGYRPSGSPS